jgi:hypothetical protein
MLYEQVIKFEIRHNWKVCRSILITIIFVMVKMRYKSWALF